MWAWPGTWGVEEGEPILIGSELVVGCPSLPPTLSWETDGRVHRKGNPQPQVTSLSDLFEPRAPCYPGTSILRTPEFIQVPDPPSLPHGWCWRGVAGTPTWIGLQVFYGSGQHLSNGLAGDIHLLQERGGVCGVLAGSWTHPSLHLS